MSTAAEKIQGEQLARVSSSFLKLRPKLLLPVGPALLGLMVWADVPRHQLTGIAATFIAMLAWFSFEAWAVSRAPVRPETFAASLILTHLGLGVLCSFSGAIRSPFLPILFAPLGIAFAAFGRSRRTAHVGCAFVFVLGSLAAATALGTGTLPESLSRMITVASSLLAGTLLYFGVTGLASAYRETALSLEQTRAAVLHAAEAQTRTLQELSSRVAHELKNPLAAIKGLVQLVVERPAVAGDERTAERLAVVLNEVARMNRVLSEYLDFTRPVGAIRTTLQPLRPFLQELSKLLEGDAHRHGVSVELTCPDIQVAFDAERLRGALLNLTQNALAAMPNGGHLLLAASVDEENVQLTIRDDGVGMSAEVLARIKEPYYSSRPGGNGLGVAIADGIARGHAGTLEFESAPGQGTTATLRLPRLGAGSQLP